MTLAEFVLSAGEERRRWPGADEIAFARFITALGARTECPLEELRAADLWIAFHASRGVPAAIQVLESSCFGDLAALLRGRGADPSEADEVVQRLRHRLLVAEPGTEPRIATYGGRGDLRAWVRVAAVRAWLNVRRESAQNASLACEDDAFVDQATNDLELELLKGKYRELFRRVFLERVEALAPETRLLLKLHYLDRLSMDEVGKVLGVHRLTVLRRLERARQELSEGTKERLLAELRLAPPEVESLLRLIQSRLDVSLTAALR
jgi:RNA polymerase sigma-70 factor (ECF subfamily)